MTTNGDTTATERTCREFSRRVPAPDLADKFRGCLLGGAVGDALGAPVEFLSLRQIIEKFGPEGIRDYVPAYGRLGAITDDTQMTLFTAEGMLRAFMRITDRGICSPPSVVAYAYLRWLHTQGIRHPHHERCLDGWLISNKELYASRAPGSTCLAALECMASPGTPARNDRKGSGGIMRVAPVGMMMARFAMAEPSSRDQHLQHAFELGCETAGITHGHPTGQLASGAFSVLVFELLTGKYLNEAINTALELLESHEDHQETTEAITEAVRLANSSLGIQEAIVTLGEGWIAEEALAIALYCALKAPSFREGVLMAVNLDGDSDSTGSLAGQLLGIMHGLSAIPEEWLEPLELRPVIEEVADDLATVKDWSVGYGGNPVETEYYWGRYPGN